MIFTFSSLTLLNILVAIIAFTIAAVIWTRRPAPGVLPFTFFMLAIVIWIIIRSLEVSVVDFTAKILLAKVLYFITATTSIMWLCFALDYSGHTWWRRSGKLLLLYAIPLITLIVLLTIRLDGLNWLGIRPDVEASSIILVWERSPIVWLQAIYIFSLFITGIILLIHLAIYGNRSQRWNIIAILISTIIAVMFHAINTFGYNPVGSIDTTPLVFTIAGMVYALTVFRFRFLDIMPIARTTIIEKMQDGILVMDKDNHVVYMNPSAERLTGSSKVFLNRQSIKGTLELLGITDSNFEYGTREQFSVSSGSKLFLQISITPLLDNKSLVTGKLIVLRDLTERQKIEQTLRESESRYSALVEQSNEGVLIIQDGTYRFANRTLAKITGSTVERIVGQTVPSGVAEDDLGMVIDRFHLRMKGQPVPNTYQVKLKRRDGTIVPVEITVGTIIYEQHFANMITVRDISERIKAEGTLKVSEEKYRSLVNNIKLGIFRSTTQGKHLEVNKAMETITGYSRDELLTLGIGELYLYPEKRQAVLNQLTSNPGNAPIEIWSRKKDGTSIIVAATITAVKDTGGNILYFDGILEDITVRKKLEEQLKELFEKEKHNREELEEEAKARGLFLNALGHELRTPLTPIVSSANLLRENFTQDTQSLQSRLINNICRSVETLALRFEELMDLGSYSQGTFILKVQPINTLELITRAAAKVQSQILQNKQTLVLELDDKLPNIEVDVSRMEHALATLLTNAIKFSRQGGKIILKSRLVEGGILIEVQDDGEGFSPEEQQRIFQPYHRVEQDRLKFTGLGLGLANVKQIIEAHKGKIWVTSQLHRGSTFSFLIPVSQQEPKPLS